MHEIISINVGQAGVQMSNAAWELFCIEHGIQANGMLKENLRPGDSLAFTTFFQEVPTMQYVPRAVSIDLEPTVLDEVRTGAYRNLWHPDQLISSCEDASNNYARGHFTHGKNVIGSTVDQIRKTVDMCDLLQGFFIISSFGGGTGSGFGALVLERLTIEYTKRSKIQVVIVPACNMSTAVVEPYNALLSVHSSTDHAELCNMADNEAVYQVCANSLDLFRPTYNNINRVLAQVFSSMTVSLRFESTLNADFDQINTNLVPFPRIHYPACNYAPIISARRAEHEQMSTQEVTRDVFEERHQMISVNMSEGKYMACCLQYRGEVTPKDVNGAVLEIKRRSDIKFVDWCPTGFKIGISSQPATSVPGSEIAQTIRNVTMLSNTTAISQVWERIGRKFDLLFSKRSFVHWYVGEGMEEGEFNEASDEMTSLIRDYTEINEEQGEEKDDTKQSSMKPKSVTVEAVTTLLEEGVETDNMPVAEEEYADEINEETEDNEHQDEESL